MRLQEQLRDARGATEREQARAQEAAQALEAERRCRQEAEAREPAERERWELRLMLARREHEVQVRAGLGFRVSTRCR